MRFAMLGLMVACGCASSSSSAPKGEPALKVVPDAQSVPGLVEKVKAMIGRHFFLDTLPDDARTVETGYRYLAAKSHSDIVRELLAEWNPAYGGELAFEWEGKPQRALVWSNMPDFKGGLIYAIAEPGGYRWQVYLGGRRAGGVSVVAKAQEIPGLVDSVRAMLGQHFTLESLPEAARTLETGLDHLTATSKAAVLREELLKWPKTYGGEVSVDWKGQRVRVLLWSDTADFNGALVYAEGGEVYLARRRK